MVHETFTEVYSGLMTGCVAGLKAIGLDMSKSTVKSLFFAGPKSLYLSDEQKEERNKVMTCKMVVTMATSMGKVKKTFKVLGINGQTKYAFGDIISLTDLECLFYYLLFNDKSINRYIDAKKIFAESSPTVLKIAENAIKHPIVAKYIKDEGNDEFLGVYNLW